MVLNRYMWPLLIFVVLLGFLSQGVTKQPTEDESMLIGKPMPTFNLPTLGDKSSEVNQEFFHDKVTVLHVWAAWCKVCVKENEMLKTLNRTHDFMLVGLSYKNSQEKADQWLNKFGNPYTVNILDKDGRLGKKLGLTGTPTSYVVDKNGVIRYVHVGALTKEEWDNEMIPEINKLLEVKS